MTNSIKTEPCWYKINAEDKEIVRKANATDYQEFPDLPPKTNGDILVIRGDELTGTKELGGKKLILPPKPIYVLGTIDLIDKQGPWCIQGQGINRTVLRKLGDLNEPLIKMSGNYNCISDLNLIGSPTPYGKQEKEAHQGAWCGIYVQGHPQDQVNFITKFNTFRNIRIRKFRIGIRIGHYSEISDSTISNQLVNIFPEGSNKTVTAIDLVKDTKKDLQKDGVSPVSPDIAANHWQNIRLEDNYYGIVRDGQTNLNDHYENMFFTNIEKVHVYLPQGGDFHCFTAQFAGTTSTDPYPFPKIYSPHGGSILLINARSENNTNIIPEFLVSHDAFVELNNVRVEYNDEMAKYLPKKPGQKVVPFESLVYYSENTAQKLQQGYKCRNDIYMRHGKLTLINCNIGAGISLPAQTNYVFINSDVGALYHYASNGVILPHSVPVTKRGFKIPSLVGKMPVVKFIFGIFKLIPEWWRNIFQKKH